MLIDSIEEPVWRDAIDRACRLSEEVYVVDLAWLRSVPWRERIAGVFDPPSRREDLRSLRAVTIRHHPESTVAAMLFAGWLASRLHWQLQRSEIVGDSAAGVLTATAHGARNGDGAVSADGDIVLRLEMAPELQVPGLAGVELHSASGLRVRT